MNGTPKVTAAEVSDLLSLETAEALCFSDPWSRASLLSQLQNDYYLTLCAKDENGTLLGYISGKYYPPEAEVFRVAVLPEARRRGIGSLLLSRFLEEIRARGCTRTDMEVRVSNAPAIALYTQNGFSPSGMRPRYYRHPTEDALFMTRMEEA